MFLKNNAIKTVKKQDMIWIATFIGFVLLLFYRCQFGFGCIDEAFYLATPYRFSQGSRIFVDEWNVSQMSSFVLYPLVKIYLTVFKSTEGILLAFRYIYTFIHSAFACWVYFKLRKEGFGAIIVSIIYLLFVPFGIMAFSYNSMGVGLMAITCINLYASNTEKATPWIVSGVTFALSTLCCPYLIILYLLFALACLVMSFFKWGGGKLLLNLF